MKPSSAIALVSAMLGAATPLILSLFSAWVIASSFFAQLAISTEAAVANKTDFKVLVNAIGMSANSCGRMYGFPRVTLPRTWGGPLLAQGAMPRESRRPDRYSAVISGVRMTALAGLRRTPILWRPSVPCIGPSLAGGDGPLQGKSNPYSRFGLDV